jgi:uncharacterized protein (DUF362 family)/NAD-dependent dihydropyrimidine dehydrogenase PreA subunit
MTVALLRTDEPKDVRQVMDLLGGMERFVPPGSKVLVKPNVCAAKPSHSGVVTEPELVVEICRLADAAGGEVTVGESPIHPFRSSRVFPRAGYGGFEKRYGFPLIDLDSAERVEIRIPGGVAVKREVVARPVLECDCLINVPVIKTHMQTVVSLGLKNIKGVVPTKDKLIIHLEGLDQGIVDLNTVISSRLVVVDGMIALEGEQGPTNGNPVHLGVIVAGDNIVEVDATCARLMGLDPHRVTHLRMAEDRGLGRLKGFEVLGDEVNALKKDFSLPSHPDLNRFLYSDVYARLYNMIRRPVDRILGRSLSRGSLGRVSVDTTKCDACAVCVKACPVGAIRMEDKLPLVEDELCIACFCCAEACHTGAISKA